MDNLSEEKKKEIEKARSNILRGNDIESASLILEKSIMDNYTIVGGKENILKIATRQILNFIEEYKNKGYLDAVREKVSLENELNVKDKMIDLMSEQLVGMMIWPTNNLEAEVILGMPEEVKEHYRKEVEKNGKDRNERI